LIDRIRAAGRYDQFEYIKLKRWSAGKVAVIGDAAHAIPPNIGRRRLRHDERAVACGLSRPRPRHAVGARHWRRRNAPSPSTPSASR